MDYVTDYIFVMSFGISNGLQVVSNLPSTACQIFFRTFYKETLHGKHDINRKPQIIPLNNPKHISIVLCPKPATCHFTLFLCIS